MADPQGRRRPVSIALLGGDGSGKTTVANRVVELSIHPARYIYLGSGFSGQNVALPTTRLLAALKSRAYRKKVAASEDRTEVTDHDVHQWTVERSGLSASLVALNRIADETYRSVMARLFQRRGNDVIADRHFLFEYAPQLLKEDRAQKRLSERVHLWFVESILPRPDMFVFLDAEPEVLVARTPELTIEQQGRYRAAVTTLGAVLPNFVSVDATRPVDEVASDIGDLIARLRNDS